MHDTDDPYQERWREKREENINRRTLNCIFRSIQQDLGKINGTISGVNAT
jgi:hypothetical protein